MEIIEEACVTSRRARPVGEDGCHRSGDPRAARGALAALREGAARVELRRGLRPRGPRERRAPFPLGAWPQKR
jgi:hypothetical protein